MKDYATWHRVDDDFFEQQDWMEQVLKMFKVAKPMMYFVNDVIGDYE